MSIIYYIKSRCAPAAVQVENGSSCPQFNDEREEEMTQDLLCGGKGRDVYINRGDGEVKDFRSC